MSLALRPATADDLDEMVALAVAGAEARRAADPDLWALVADPAAAIRADLAAWFEGAGPPVTRRMILARDGGRLAGLVNAILLPVPPIYAGAEGMPGLILGDSVLAEDAPEGTGAALLDAAEAALRAEGAKVLLAAALPGSAWEEALAAGGYVPLTLYLTKGVAPDGGTARPATEADIPRIVTLSAENRETLHAIDPFWRPHPEADARFDAWMRRSLTLTDRDMLMPPGEAPEGYSIAQPATALHVPAGHDATRLGVIDDYFHRAFRDPGELGAGDEATALLRAAETALARRGREAVLLVCPAGWSSKLSLLAEAGYRPGLVWHMRR